jgi:glycosyltransferase involved in cell wall biosynthesis
MMRINHICIITASYPTPVSPASYTFVDQLACAFADAGKEVTVIAPVSRFKEHKDKAAFYQAMWQKTTDSGKKINIFHPRFFSIPTKKIGFIHTGIWTYKNFMNSVQRHLTSLPRQPDVLYSHFLFPSGYTVAFLGRKLGIPSFCAYGESSLWSVKSVGMQFSRRILRDITGIVSVSTENKRRLTDNRLCADKKIGVFPNGVNHNLFYPRAKKAMREKYEFPQDGFIGAYTGSFSNAKGVMRVQQAALKIKSLRMIYIGGGNLKPQGDNIIYCAKTTHAQIPELLSAADFFVLPTLEEGCCNAVIEAMACGLPIISSDRAFHDDILHNEYSLRVNPEDVQAIQSAMETLLNNPNKREQMAQAALTGGEHFDVNKRAENILDWMEGMSVNLNH